MKLGPKFKFIRGSEEAYDPTGIHLDAVYFATSKDNVGKILMNGVCYGTAPLLGVESVTVDSENRLVVSYNIEGVDDFVFPLNSILAYVSGKPAGLKVPVSVGNIEAGTTVEDLQKKSISELLDDILFPEIQPEVTQPIASLVFINGYVNNAILEVGLPAPTPADFITSFSRGTSKVIGLPVLSRAGELIDDEKSKIFFEEEYIELPETILPGDMTYTYQAHFGQGDELLTSQGNPASIDPNPLPESTLLSEPIHLYGTLPFFSNGASASISNVAVNMLAKPKNENAKLPLQKWDTELMAVKFASEAASGERMKFKFPTLKEIEKVEYMNTISGRWEVMKESDYTVTPIEQPINVNGINVDYNLFTTAEGTPLKGALQVRFTLKAKDF